MSPAPFKSTAAETGAQKNQGSQAAQARPRDVLVAELHVLADGTPGEFWAWWWMLTGAERRLVLNAMEEVKPVGR